MNAPEPAPVRLTQFSHGGGCGCKIARGLLVACAPEAADAVLAVFRDEGFERAAQIGTITPAPARIVVR